MISAVFRRGGDVSFVVEELKAVFDPRGGHWVGGKYVPSLLAALGDVIDRHLHAIGFLKGPEALGGESEAQVMPLAASGGAPAEGGGRPASSPLAAGFRSCPKCQQPTLIHQEGCDSCASCGYSKCG